ncbi:S8 family serine peptidase [Robertkochia flava]|uniref:S8 family serine peptidase n=1 Tax=Robertkochia flava TaxID=3447986 RepID=UPI001CCC15F9|nr:S8 family serine peptidase [Robertkochia marina]
MDELDKDGVDSWLKRNASQRKALRSMLHALKNEELQEIDSEEDHDTSNATKNKIMTKITQLFKKLGVLTLVLWMAGSLNVMAQNKDFVPGKVRVKIKPNQVEMVAKGMKKSTAIGQLKIGLSSFDKISAKFAATKMERVFPHAGKNESRHIKHGLHLWYEIDVENEADLLTVVSEYGGNEYVEMAEAIRVKSVDYTGVERVEMPSSPAMPMSTNDPYLADQWHLFNDGTLPQSEPGVDINVRPAWDITTGTPNVIVAVVDGGIDTEHEDLRDNLWVNEAELNGEPGVDDDFNGYIDDVHGYNFVDRQGDIVAHEHGTHVAGTVAATSNNGKGVAGVAGGSGNGDGVRMISAQVFSPNGGGGNFPAAIVYGADNGAVISQNSWGYQTSGYYEQAVLDAIDYFVEEAGNYPGSPMKGGVVLFAAGNNGVEELHYPSVYEKTIAVAATGANYKKAVYSSYGNWVDLTTTGGDVSQGVKNQVLSTIPANGYGYLQGTSMATPHASGVAALIVSKYGSSTFTNKELKQRLLTGVRDIESYNPEYAGKLGLGFMDAALALAENDNTAPNTITDLNLVGISQDFASLSFSVPSDEGDGTPEKYHVYWSANENMGGKSELIVTNDFREVGDVIEVTIEDLDFETVYYFSVVAEDRWGNRSEMSQIISDKTNQGPDINTDLTSLNYTLDVTTVTSVAEMLQIQNDQDGILNWTAETRQVSNQASWTSVQMPAAGTAKSTAQLNVEMQEIQMPEPFPTKEAVLYAWEPSEKRDYTASPIYVIGEEDTTMTNSTATRFDVTEPDGFNLTRITTYLNLDKEDGPAVMEIYKGTQIHEDNLIYRDNNFEGNKENDTRYYFSSMQEQLFFEQGESFWVVFHVPANNLYPVGMAPETTPGYSDRCLMSFDLGKSWVPISQAIGSDAWGWVVTASSQYAPLGQYTTLTPSEGQIAGIGTTDMEVAVDASNLINGTYNSNIVIQSNDADEPFYRVPVRVGVSGQKPELSTVNILDFGSVFEGLSSTREMTIVNSGLGRFKTQSITSSNPAFVVNTGWSLPNIDAKSEYTLSITYTPSGIGNENAVITMTSANGDVHEFNVFGVGTATAEMEVAPVVIDMDSLMVGEPAQASVTLTNNGEYPLQYGFPAFADDLSHIENLPDNVPQYNYVMEKTPYNDYVFNDISTTGTDVTDFFINNSGVDYYNVELGFDFPYYGGYYDNLNITNQGALTIGTNSNFASSPGFGRSFMPDGYIAAALREYAFTLGGSVHYKREPGKFILQYTDVRNSRDRATVALTFQIELYSNGDIKFIYDKFDGLFSFQLNGYYSGIENESKTDGVIVHSQNDKVSLPHAPQQIVHIHSPGIGLIKSVTEPKGLVQPGGSKELLIVIDEEKLIEGNHTEYISVLSNDPNNSSQAIEINLNVIGGGVSQLTLSETGVDFGNVFQQADVTGVIEVKNDGSRQIDITDIAFANGQLSFDGETSLIIEPNQTYYIDYTLNTQDLGQISDVLVVTDAQGSTYETTFSGEIVDAPGIGVMEAAYAETMEPDTEVMRSFKVTNTGNATLEYALAASEHVTVNEPEAAVNAVEEYTYVYRSTYDDGSKPTFQWIKLGLEDKVPFYLAQGDNWEQLDLPFEFEFYQKKYTKIWMGTQGVLSLQEEVDESYSTFIPNRIPEDDNLNAIISPYFGRGGPNVTSDEAAWGRFMKAFDDKVVFEWRSYTPGGFGGTYSFQAILYKNGKIKFQYKDGSASGGLIGIENEDGTKGFEIAYFQPFFADGVAVDIYPAKKETLEAGASRSYDLKFSTMGADAGVYTESLKVINNTPLTPEVEVPVEITVNGEPRFTFNPDTLDMGEQMVLPGKSYSYDISFSNTGKKEMTVSNLHVEDGATAILEHLVDGFFGPSWRAVRSTDAFTVAPGFESKTFRLTVTPAEANPEYVNKVVATTDFGTTEEMPIMADFKLPPSFTVNEEPVYHMAYNNDVYDHTLQMGNAEGQSPLVYTLGMDYERPDATAAEAMEASEGKAVLLSNALSPAGNTPAIIPANATFANLLAHDNNQQAYTTLGYGGGSEFTTSTRFVAPEGGFNLSHVQTWYAPGTWLDSDIKVEIRVGSNVASGKVLHKETLSYAVSEEDFDGSLVTFELGKTVELLPYEQFYVVFTYPLGAEYPQGIAEVAEDVTNRFQFVSGGFWYDLADAGYSGSGWMVRAGEVTPAEKNWISIPGDMQGEVAAGGTFDLGIQLNPQRASAAVNTGSLLITTNDPEMRNVSIPVRLDINQAPKVVADEVYYVNENDTLTLNLQLDDLEGDMISGAVLLTEKAGAGMTFENEMITFTYTPGYEDSGIHTFDIATEDEHGIKGVSVIRVDVQDVNRKPEVAEIPTQYINLYSGDYQLNFGDIFADPDGEQVHYTATISDEGVADLFRNDNAIMVTPIKLGTTTVTLKGTDPRGGEITTSFDVVVIGNVTEDAQLDASWKVHPNPVDDIMNIRMYSPVMESMDINFYNALGMLIKSAQSDGSDGTIEISVSDLTPGVYYVEMVTANAKSVKKIVKN